MRETTGGPSQLGSLNVDPASEKCSTNDISGATLLQHSSGRSWDPGLPARATSSELTRVREGHYSRRKD